MAKRKANLPVLGASPRVNLLPDKQRAQQQQRKTLPKLLFTVLGSAVVAGLIWAAGIIPVQFAHDESLRLDDEFVMLTTELAEYSEVNKQLTEIGQLSKHRETVTAREILVIDIQDRVAAELPTAAQIVGFAVASTDQVEGDDEASSSLLCSPGVATLTIDIASESLIPAAELIENLEDVAGVVCGQATGSQLTDATYVTTIAMVLDEESLSGRFQEVTDE